MSQKSPGPAETSLFPVSPLLNFLCRYCAIEFFMMLFFTCALYAPVLGRLFILLVRKRLANGPKFTQQTSFSTRILASNACLRESLRTFHYPKPGPAPEVRGLALNRAASRHPGDPFRLRPRDSACFEISQFFLLGISVIFLILHGGNLAQTIPPLPSNRRDFATALSVVFFSALFHRRPGCPSW